MSLSASRGVFLVLIQLAVCFVSGTMGFGDLTRGPFEPAVHGARMNRKLMQQNWQVSFPYLTQGANGTSPEGPQPPSNITECPKITLRLNTIEVYDGIVNDPAGLISVQCYTRDGQQFSSIQFYALAASVRSALGARYTPNLNVAQLSCGEEASCKIIVGRTTRAWGDGGAAVSTWRQLVEGGCWFDYRHFTQLSYREQMSAWTCNRPPTRYTLECVECAEPDFPWDVALASGGPPLNEEGSSVPEFGFNSTMIVVSIVVCSVAVVLVGMALFVRHRRRARDSDRRVMEMIEQAREARARALPPGHKPPSMFVMGDAKDESPPRAYKGPIVVLHCPGEGLENGYEENGEITSYPVIAIAKPDLSSLSMSEPEAAAAGSSRPSSVAGAGAGFGLDESSLSRGGTPSGGARTPTSTPAPLSRGNTPGGSSTPIRSPSVAGLAGPLPEAGAGDSTDTTPAGGDGGSEQGRNYSRRSSTPSSSGNRTRSSRRRVSGASMSPLASGARRRLTPEEGDGGEQE